MVKTSMLLGAAIALALAGPVLAGNPAGGNGRFLPPTQVQTESGEINLRVATQGVPRSGVGHAGPHVADFDADGTPDLLVGDIFGNVFFYQGLGNDSAAPYADAEPVRMADGELLVFKNWWCTSLRPQLVDYNDDGHMDLIAGGFGGQSYVALGAEDGFAAPVTIKDENGNEIALGVHYVYEGEETGYLTMDPMPFVDDASAQAKGDRSEGFTLVDWDDDGDLDILLGASSGRLYLRENIGTRSDPAYAAHNLELTATDGEPLSTSMSHAIPVVADWDGDGDFDIVSSGASGQVVWFRNVGEPGEPAFAPREELVEPMGRGGDRSGTRSTVEVVDYDGDGDMDLLVGDMEGYVWFYPIQFNDQR